MPEIIVKAAGQPIPRVEKRAAEQIVYTLNCSELLDKNELIVSVETPITLEGMDIISIRPRKGTSIEIKIANSPIETATYIDYTVYVPFLTILNSSKMAVFNVRVYKQ